MKAVKRMQIFLLLLLCSTTAYSQSSDWQIANGKAVAEKTISLPGKSEDVIYEDVSRWLTEYFKSRDGNLKALINGEYLRGVGNQIDLIQSGRLNHASFRYTFVIRIKREELTVKLVDGVLTSSGGQDAESSFHNIEEFFNTTGSMETEDAAIRENLNTFSNSFFNSLQGSFGLASN